MADVKHPIELNLDRILHLVCQAFWLDYQFNPLEKAKIMFFEITKCFFKQEELEIEYYSQRLVKFMEILK